jgi:tetratricopeptide (TPR) repeat protein
VSDQQSLLNEFLQDLRKKQAGLEAGAALLLDTLAPRTAQLLRLSAIPHQYSEDILSILSPELERGEIKKRCEEFSEFSFVSSYGAYWVLSDQVRRYLFLQWLTPQHVQNFQQASARLAAFFEPQSVQSQGELAEIAIKRRMFHLVGADQESGFGEFERLFRRARHNRWLSECSQLVRLMHEYDNFLSPSYRAWLKYHEAKLSADRSDLEVAEARYQEVLDDPAAPRELRTAAYVRIGYVHNERRNWDEAIHCYNSALQLAANARVPGILHDIGAAYRDKGDLEHAEALLQRSINLALKEGNLSDQALAWNSLGTLALKRRDGNVAAQAFEKSLDALMQSNEEFRTAQVYNNLGLVYCDVPDWERSEGYFMKSLEIASRAGDTSGQAFALSNMARVQASQGNLKNAVLSYTKAIDLFTEVRHRYDAALVKHNRGKLFAKMEERQPASKDFIEAIETFRSLGKHKEAIAVVTDLRRLDAPAGLPWWIWIMIGIFVLFVLLLLTLAFVVSAAEPG